MKILRLIILIVMFGCNDNVKITNVNQIVDKINDSISTNSVPIVIVKQNNVKNLVDNDSLKQGVWDYMVNNKVKGFVTYLNGQLIGHFKYKTPYPDSIEGEYKNGLINGLLFTYRNDSIADMVNFKNNDTIIWTAFPLADYVIGKPKPIKGFIIESKDSVYVKCPFRYNKNLFYEGLFYDRKPKGTHKIYYLSGGLKFISDYSTRTFIKYGSNGQIIEKGKF